MAAAARGPRHVYVHVPFCRAKCDYCDFFSLPLEESGADAAGASVVIREIVPGDTGSGALLDAYVAAVVAEWAAESEALAVRRVETVYLGGGTPSLLGWERLERLLEPLQPLLTPRAEVTVEVNPEDVDEVFARWAAARRLRVSLGAQSFDRELRETLGRRAAADPGAALSRLRAAGVENLSVDLMFGIPGQTRVRLGAELAAVARLRPDHVSWYELEVVDGTPLAARTMSERSGAENEAAGRERGEGPGEGEGAGGYEDADRGGNDTDDDYRFIVRGLGRLGYRWYETSNFARPGRRCRHNLAYWRRRDYLGLGPGAVSTVGDRRWRTRAALERYLGVWAPHGGSGRRAGLAGLREAETLDPATRARERLLLAARIGDATPLDELAPILDRAAAGPLAERGFIALGGGTLRVTRKGRYVANEVCVRLFRDSSFQGA